LDEVEEVEGDLEAMEVAMEIAMEEVFGECLSNWRKGSS
jgi:hypothetical protein